MQRKQIQAAIAKRLQKRNSSPAPAAKDHKCSNRCICGAAATAFSGEAGWNCGKPTCIKASIEAKRRARPVARAIDTLKRRITL